jgi:hypothetical protein|tara:strand:- start:508 stop:633 length:126 start_codon:yes stop_codon:yes gene_type:complete
MFNAKQVVSCLEEKPLRKNKQNASNNSFIIKKGDGCPSPYS